MDIKNTFIGGRMNKDDDERLLQEGEYRHAENINVINSEDSDVGAIENTLSNRRLTTLGFGTNPKTITPKLCINKVRNKIYWMVKSDNGCYLIEYNVNGGFASFVLSDTRPINERVFSLDENFLITGIDVIIGETEDEDLLLWTDDNMQPCCINIERAKGYGENGFDKEDIYLIKKPPSTAPSITPISSVAPSNYIEEKFFLFAYRYKYLDGEYSALSSYTNYAFTPKEFQLDYITGENLGMVNRFNTCKITFNTGDKRVVKVDIVAKSSNSNTIYKIESFDKAEKNWGNNEERTFNFNNNKIYTILPETEYLRYFDNVPLKAKALTLIENRPIFGNYVEGYDLKTKFNRDVNINITPHIETYPVEGSQLLYLRGTDTIPGDRAVVFSISADAYINLNAGQSLVITVNLKSSQYTSSYTAEFVFIATQNYATFGDLSNDDDFINLIENVMTSHFDENVEITGMPIGYSYEGIRDGYKVSSDASFAFRIKAPIIDVDTNSGNLFIPYTFEDGTSFFYKTTDNITTLKSNRDYEVALVYKDEYQRSTTALTSENNSIYIPIENSVTQNKLRVYINNFPPEFATHYKVVVKSQPLSYQTIYVNQYFVDGVFRWIKLEGENKDKVKEGDILILKADKNGPATSIIKTKVLEVGVQESDFIIDNTDENDVEIVEPAGFYMKIRPSGFVMNYDSNEFFESEGKAQVYDGRPVVYSELFSFEETEGSDQWTNRPLYEGSSITLYFKNYERADGDARFEKTYIVQTNYDSFEEWFNDTIVGTNLTASNGDVFDDISIERGFATRVEVFGTAIYSFNEDLTNGKLYLRVGGIYAGNIGNRRSFLDVKVSLRNVKGFYVFETETRNAEQEFFYESEETFEIINGSHQGNIQNQGEQSVLTNTNPAIVELNFFNAYCFGNGVESYQVKDSQLKESLNVDMKPTIVSVDGYKQVRRFADICFGGTFNEGVNNINEFFIQNFKSLDKRYGSIQLLFTRNDNFIVFQEFKTSYVLYNKNTISTATGQDVITRDSQILGEQITYAGENGIGRTPESFANDDYRIYFFNPNRGVPIRLSMDGTENIENKMSNWFREKVLTNPNGKIYGGFDPHNKVFVLNFKEGIPAPIMPKFNTVLNYYEKEEVFYQIPINEVFEEVYIDYEVSSGKIDIATDFDGDSTSETELTGTGTITVPTGRKGILKVNVEAETKATFSIENKKSESPEVKVKLLTLSDRYAFGRTITNRYQTNTSNGYYERNIIFKEENFVLYEELTGQKGEGFIPADISKVGIESYKKQSDNLIFEEDFFLGILLSETEYSSSPEDIEEMVNLATFSPINTNNISKYEVIKRVEHEITRPNDNTIIYLIWDYRKLESESGDESGSDEPIMPE